MTDSEILTLVDDLFEEEALAIGGLVELEGIPDQVVTRLFQCLSATREKTLRRIEGPARRHATQVGRRPRNGEPHPAIEEFLAKLGRNGN